MGEARIGRKYAKQQLQIQYLVKKSPKLKIVSYKYTVDFIFTMRCNFTEKRPKGWQNAVKGHHSFLVIVQLCFNKLKHKMLLV